MWPKDELDVLAFRTIFSSEQHASFHPKSIGDKLILAELWFRTKG